MKLEILKDNRSTAARVGTIMTVPEKKGKEWIKKGYAKISAKKLRSLLILIRWIWWKRLRSSWMMRAHLIKNPINKTKKMATTNNNVKGNLLGLYISTDGGTNYTLVGSATSCTLSINNDTLDVTKKSASGNRELMYGLQTATVTAEGFVKYDDTQGSEQLRTVALTASDDSNYLVRFSTGVAGDKEVYFNAIITSFEETVQ